LVDVTNPELASNLYDERTRAALDYADAMTGGFRSDEFVSEAMAERVRTHFDTEEIVCLTELIAWENASARFNRALGVRSQELWRVT